mgnify:CR=1
MELLGYYPQKDCDKPEGGCNYEEANRFSAVKWKFHPVIVNKQRPGVKKSTHLHRWHSPAQSALLGRRLKALILPPIQ